MSAGAAPIRSQWWVRGELPASARWFLGATVVLVCGGLVVLFSASSYRGLHEHGDPTFFLRRQALGAFLGVFALVLGATIQPRVWVRWSPLLLVVCLALLVYTLTQGKINGARRWVSLGIKFQPSEIAKIVLPLFLAWCYGTFGIASPRGVTSRLRYHLALVAVVGLTSGLVIVQPDYGTALFLLTVSGMLLAAGGLPLGFLFRCLLSLVPVAGVLYWVRKDVIMARFQGLIDPRSLYQVDQSLAGIQAGGLWGTGLGNGLQKTAIPYQFTDFIAAVIGEELGYIGFLMLFAMLTLLLQSGWRVVSRCSDPVLRLVALAVVVNLVLQSLINVAVATASAPTKGIGLPFVSYGSSSLTVALFQVGLLIGIARAVPAQVDDVGPARLGVA
ncbi:MAG: FtsW/RodA/SpoVE family cell cycle protein [Planctomycetota bacterium]